MVDVKVFTRENSKTDELSAGVNMVIASGSEEGALRRILQGEEVGTVFAARESHLRVRKSWLAFGKRLQGDLVVDAGCVKALEGGSSLLAAGIKAVDGDFEAGSTVRVLAEDRARHRQLQYRRPPPAHRPQDGGL